MNDTKSLTTIITWGSETFAAGLANPLDISIPIREGIDNVNCFYAPPVEFDPVVAGSFIGATRAGGPVNFLNVKINPHGNGTHTECVGHISVEKFTIRECLTRYHYFAKMVSLFPTRLPDGDRVILEEQLRAVVQPGEAEALIIRTLPNHEDKQRRQYSGTNPPYLHHEGVAWLVECGVEHLLLDLPSVDREEDSGKLLAHRAFWEYPEKIRSHCTITELIFAPSEIPDGLYLLNLQTASFDIDVSPSKPVLFRLEKES
jgi:kynurenine formamidase